MRRAPDPEQWQRAVARGAIESQIRARRRREEARPPEYVYGYRAGYKAGYAAAQRSLLPIYYLVLAQLPHESNPAPTLKV